MRLCHCCGEGKSETEYYRRGASLTHTCKGCIRARRIRHYIANKAATFAAMKRYLATPAGRAARRRAYTTYNRKIRTK